VTDEKKGGRGRRRDEIKETMEGGVIRIEKGGFLSVIMQGKKEGKGNTNKEESLRLKGREDSCMGHQNGRSF